MKVLLSEAGACIVFSILFIIVISGFESILEAVLEQAR